MSEPVTSDQLTMGSGNLALPGDTVASQGAARHSEQKLSRRQAAIISAYTGMLCGPFEDMHAYVDSLPGFKGIMTVGLAVMADKIAEAAKDDFLALCPDRSDT